MKAWKYLILWILLLTYLVVTLSFAASNRSRVVCKALQVDISDADRARFVKQSDVLEILDQSGVKYNGTQLTKVNCDKIERLIYKHSAVKRADAFITVDGCLNIRVEQRQPLLRVFNRDNVSYYIDVNGGIMPLSGNFSAHTLVASGNISEPFDLWRIRSLKTVDTDSMTKKQRIIFDLFELAQFITGDDFWNAQIEQIYVNENAEFELIPRVGGQVVLLGSLDEYKYKFEKLRALYRTFNQIGWNNYSKINLKYKNQIICTKR